MPQARSILVLISARGGGDWPPLVALAAGLHDRGYEVALLCDTSTGAAVRSTGLPTIFVPPDLEQDVYIHPRWVQQLMQSGQELGPETPNPLVGWAQTCAPAVRAAIGERGPKVVISSLFCMGLADLLASELRVPWCFVNPSFFFGEDSARPWDADFRGLSARMLRYWFLPLAQRATLVLHATDPHFDFQPAGLPVHHHYVGPLLWEIPAAEPSYLSEPGPPWALVALSSVPQEGEVAIARAAIRALEREPVRVLVTLAPGHAREELGEVPENVRLAEFVPHGRVLERSRLVISHAGHGIVMKALYHGVPMVLVPWGRDQPGVAARAEALGVAAVVQREQFDDAAIDGAIHLVLDGPLYTETVQAVSRRLQSDDSVAAACTHVEAFFHRGEDPE